MMGEKMDELKNVELLQEFNELIGYKRSIKDFMGLFLAADLAATKAIKEHKLYKKLGYTWSTFCTERLKMGRKAVDTYLRFEKEFGPELYEEAVKNSISVNAMESILRSEELKKDVNGITDKDEKIKHLKAELDKTKADLEEAQKKHDFSVKFKKDRDRLMQEISDLTERIETQGIPPEEQEAIRKIQTMKIQLRGMLRIIESADIDGHSDEVKEELLLLAQYAHDRGELCFGRVMERVRGASHETEREMIENDFRSNWKEED